MRYSESSKENTNLGWIQFLKKGDNISLTAAIPQFKKISIIFHTYLMQSTHFSAMPANHGIRENKIVGYLEQYSKIKTDQKY